MTKAGKHPSASTAARDQDAIAMLMADHRKVKETFKAFEKLKDDDGSDDDKGELAMQVCDALKVHAQIEEEIFYPAVRAAIDDDDLMDEADVEHASAKELIEQLEAMQPGDELYDAKVIVLGELIDHHVKEEEEEMFPKVRKAKVDTAALAVEMLERRMELMTEMGYPEEARQGSQQAAQTGKPARRGERHA